MTKFSLAVRGDEDGITLWNWRLRHCLPHAYIRDRCHWDALWKGVYHEKCRRLRRGVAYSKTTHQSAVFCYLHIDVERTTTVADFTEFRVGHNQHGK